MSNKYGSIWIEESYLPAQIIFYSVVIVGIYIYILMVWERRVLSPLKNSDLPNMFIRIWTPPTINNWFWLRHSNYFIMVSDPGSPTCEVKWPHVLQVVFIVIACMQINMHVLWFRCSWTSRIFVFSLHFAVTILRNSGY